MQAIDVVSLSSIPVSWSFAEVVEGELAAYVCQKVEHHHYLGVNILVA